MKRYMIRFLLILSLFLFSGCDKITDTFFSDESDVSVGLNFDKEIRSSEQHKISINQEAREYIQTIVDTILKSEHIKKKDVYKYQVTLLEDDEMVNAFCVPGGYIYVYTGLMKFIENEATLAAILAHEIAHAERRHARRRMIGEAGLKIVLAVIFGAMDNSLAELGLELASGLAILHNNREDEMEADELAFLYLEKSPYYRGAMTYFFEKISEEQKGSNPLVKRFEGLLSTHPIPEARLEKNKERIQKAGLKPPTERNIYAERYMEMVESL